MKKVTAKGNTMLGMMIQGIRCRNLKNCSKNLKDLAYKVILRPKLEYPCSIWDPYTDVNIIKTLEGVQRRSAHFVCNKFSYHESVTSMLNELDWPSLQQRRAEKRMALSHRIVNETVDVEAPALMTRTKQSSRKLNRVQYQTHSSKKDCYKYSFVPRAIIHGTTSMLQMTTSNSNHYLVIWTCIWMATPDLYVLASQVARCTNAP